MPLVARVCWHTIPPWRCSDDSLLFRCRRCQWYIRSEISVEAESQDPRFLEYFALVEVEKTQHPGHCSRSPLTHCQSNHSGRISGKGRFRCILQMQTTPQAAEWYDILCSIMWADGKTTTTKDDWQMMPESQTASDHKWPRPHYIQVFTAFHTLSADTQHEAASFCGYWGSRLSLFMTSSL